jgi:glycosyltransferase involved in cell wall biosynthesis
MSTALVSIVVPCYNYAHYLGYTLENVRGQRYPHWECIVVDDGSTDHTDEVAEQFRSGDARFRYIRQENKGLSGARNTGIAASRGKYIQLLDSDDLIHPDKLAIQVAILESDERIGITYGKSLFFQTDNPGRLYPSRGLTSEDRQDVLRGGGSGKEMLKRLVVDNIMEVSCALARASLFAQVGTFDETYRSYEDWQYWIRCAVADVLFDYSPEAGTETYIRTGHQSMMADKRKLVTYGICLRKFLRPYLSGRQRLYNAFRMYKLYTRKLLRIY